MIRKLWADDLKRDVYVISSGGSWIDGVYDSYRAANYAFRFPDEELRKLQNSINPNGVITFKMLQELRKHINSH